MEQAGQTIKRMLQASQDNSETGTKRLTAQDKADMYNASEGFRHQVDGYNCPLCKNRGDMALVGTNEMFGYQYDYVTPCKCMKVRQAIIKLGKSGLKDVVKDCTFDKYQTPNAWQAQIKDKAMRFCKDEQHKWFCIGGQSGAGKTHLCTAIAVDLIKQGKAARYMLWVDEINKLKTVMLDSVQYESIMNDLKTAPVLYIDDLFKSGHGIGADRKALTPTDIRMTFEIINYRINNPELITIISTELTLEELLKIDQATAGRIYDKANAGGYFINISSDISKNWRLRGVEKI